MMKTKRALPVPVFIPVILFAFLVLLLIMNPFAVQAQELDVTPTFEPTPIPTIEPTTEPTAIPEEPTTSPEIIDTLPAEPTETPANTPEIPTNIPETTAIPTETPTTEPTFTPEVTETAIPSPTETVSATPTVTTTSTALPLIVPLIQPQGVEIIPDRYIVVYKSADLAINANITGVSAPGVSVDHTFSSVINGFSASLSPDALTTLRQDPNIAFIEADQVVWLAGDITINSIQSSPAWGLDRIDQQNLPLDGNYAYYQSGAGVNVYLMDSGINIAHPDFGGRATNDFDTVDGGMTDCNGHGTRVAGIIGSSTYGVAKAATIHGVRVTNCEGNGSVSSVIAAIDWITANHVKPAVVNLSYINGPSDAEDLAISRSIAAGVTYVAAAGNESGNACLYSPSRVPGVITVGAIDLTDTAAGYSNQGACLDLFAPGSDIPSTSMGGSVEVQSGTSMAAPHAAGAAALFLQSNPSASPASVASWLIGNSTKGVLNGVKPDSPNRLLFTNPILPSIPSAPVLVRPSNGSVSNQTLPSFAWKMTSTADVYTFQFSAEGDFATILKEETGTFLSYTQDADLPDGLYYWRVRAVNSNGDPAPGDWSAPFSFTVDTQGPAAPVLGLPADNASPVGIPTFTWQPVSGAMAYQFEVDDTPDFASPVLTTPDGAVSGLPALTKTTFLPTGLLLETSFFWHVRARDQLGNWGDWSESRAVTIQAAIPVSPLPVSPAAGAAFKTNPTLIWNSVPGGVYYQVQVADNAQFTGTLAVDTNKPIGIFSHTISASLSDKIWYWRVRAFNSTKGAGNWSAVRSLIMDTTGPAAPVLISPATDNSPLSVPVFTWRGAADAKTYQFVLGTSTDGGTTISPLVISPDGSVPGQPALALASYKPAGLPLETLCYWHVRAFDALGNPGSWSESRTITLQKSIPPAPMQASPMAGAAVNAIPALSWNAAATAETYEIQVSNSAVFPASYPVINAEKQLNKTPASPLTDGIWYWRVRGRNNTGGVGLWSAARAFVLDTQSPLAPVLISPVTGYLFATPAFAWKVSITATGYQFEYGSATDATIATFSPLYTSPILTTTAHTPPNIPVGMYYWHVRASDVAGNWSAWSDLRVINMFASKIPGPTLISPVSGSSTNSRTPTLTWKCSAGAISYNVEISDNLTFSGENMHSLTPEEGMCSVQVLDGLLTHNGKWYWRVSATNVSQITGDFNSAGNFTFDDQLPPAPLLVSPANLSSTLRAIPAFTWSPVTGANAYQFQIDDDGFAEPVLFSTPGETFPGTPIATTAFVPSNLKPMVNYSWRVKTRDAAQNWSTWSPVRNFSLLPAIPAAPVPVSPSTSFLTNDPLPMFTWNSVFSGETYRIQLDKSAGFSAPIINESLGSGILTYTPPLIISDGLYFWRIQAVNLNHEPGKWSVSRTITIDTSAPPAPKLLIPAQNSNTLRATPVFSWASVTGANAYQFQLDDENGFVDPLVSTPGDTIPGTPIPTTSYKPQTLSTLTPYFWRVRSRDAAGNWGMWSDTYAFTVLPLIPPAPILTSPAAGFITRVVPALTWSSTALAENYELAIDDDNRFLSPLLLLKTGNILTHTPTDLPADGLYYWRVRAINAHNEGGSWSAARTFIVDTKAPLSPNLLAPKNEAAGIRVIPSFTWSPSTGAKYYQFQMDDNNFGDPEDIYFSTPGGTVPGFPITVSYAKPPALSLLTAYHWRVRACDAAGNWGDWSSLRAFTLQPGIPAAPVSVSPLTGTITKNVKPVFVVKESPSILSYEVELTPNSPIALKMSIFSTTSTITYPGEKLPDCNYSWRTRMVNAANESGAWSPSSLFTVDTLPPASPVLTAPANGSANGRIVPVFAWKPVPGAKYYQIQIDDDQVFASPEYATPGDTIPGTPLTVTAFKPANLTALTTYYWRVRAIDAAGNIGNWSESFSVTVLPPIPSVPVQISPSNGVLTNDPTPEFRWKSIAGAVEYEIQISNTLTFVSSLKTGNTASYIPAANLETQGKYYWRIRALNTKNEPGLWSPVWYFTLDTSMPAAPMLSSPVEDTLLAPGTPVFTWIPPAGAVQYQFEYDDNADFGSPVYTSPDGTISGLPAITATSFKPPSMTPAVQYYWHVRARDAAGNWGTWSAARRISIQAPLPGTPVLSSPVDRAFVTNRKPVLSWSSSLYGYVYEVQVSNSLTFASILKDEVTVSPNSLTLSFADDLPPGDLYWRVRALNVNGRPGTWSSARKLTVLTGYDFSGDSTDWLTRPGGEWIIDGGSLSTTGSGLVNSTSSAMIGSTFSEFTYEARVKMGFDTSLASGIVGNDHGLVIFGSDALNSQNDILNGYYFHIGQKMTGPGSGLGQFGIDRMVNGAKRPLTGTGYLSGPVNFNGWNVIKVVSRGTMLSFYINNIQVYSFTNTTYRSGRLGVYSVNHVDPSQVFLVDWVRLASP